MSRSDACLSCAHHILASLSVSFKLSPDMGKNSCSTTDMSATSDSAAGLAAFPCLVVDQSSRLVDDVQRIQRRHDCRPLQHTSTECREHADRQVAVGRDFRVERYDGAVSELAGCDEMHSSCHSTPAQCKFRLSVRLPMRIALSRCARRECAEAVNSETTCLRHC